MKEEFCNLQPVKVFSDRLQVALCENRNATLFWKSGNTWLRDAILADNFARKTRAVRVRLLPSERPDFEVDYPRGQNLRVESTIADMPDRRMGAEHKEWEQSGLKVHEDPERCWIKRRRAIPGALRLAANTKASGLYSSDTSLLIYLNLSTYGTWRAEIEKELIENTESARGYFRSIWVLWDARL